MGETMTRASDIVSTATRRFAEAGIQRGRNDAADIVMRPEAYAHFLTNGEADELGIGGCFQDGLCREGRMTIDVFTYRRVIAGLYGSPQKTTAGQQSIPKALQAVRAHYDLGNDFFKSILDRRHMLYSAAMYCGSTRSLEEAQQKKLLVTGTKLNPERGDVVLDIGCGFGGLLRFLHDRWGVHGVGITLSAEQAKLARGLNGNRPIQILEMDYRHLVQREQRFERIVSVGMFEHVGPENYPEFFGTCKQLLKPGGSLLLHSIFGGGMNPWLETNIFPGAELPLNRQIRDAIRGHFVAMDWHFFGPSYDKTLMAWRSNMLAAVEELKAAGYDDRFFRTIDYYLLLSAGLFRAKVTTVGQIHLFHEPQPNYEKVR